MRIRRLIREDIPAIFAIEKECFTLPWSKEALEKEIDNPVAYYVIAETTEEVVGYAGMWAVMGEGQVTNIAVASKYRGQGIGKQLVEALIEAGEKRNLEAIFLEVRKSNEAAKVLYEKAGFTNIGTRKNYYEKPKEDAIMMQRIIQTE